jgi:hypothetical protein
MSVSLVMSMTSLSVAGAGRGVSVARTGRAAQSKASVASGSAFFPTKTAAKMTMKSSLAGASSIPSIVPFRTTARAACVKVHRLLQVAASAVACIKSTLRSRRRKGFHARAVPRARYADTTRCREKARCNDDASRVFGASLTRQVLGQVLYAKSLFPPPTLSLPDLSHPVHSLFSLSFRLNRCRASPRGRDAQAHGRRKRRACDRGGWELARVHPARHEARAGQNLGIPSQARHSRRQTHTEAEAQEGTQVPRPRGRAKHVEQGEEEEPQVI